MTAVTSPRTPSLQLSMFRGARFYAWLTGLALVLGVVSLTWPSTPSYDPWSWLIWGREIFHALTGSGPAADSALHITGGSSWKPLPVVFTSVLALFGSAQPDLWLIVAHAGAALTVLMTAKLTMRIVWGLVVRSAALGAFLQEPNLLRRAVAVIPVVFAGAAALICSAFTPHYPLNMLLGYSEGVMSAAFLIAVERAWDGHHRQAFALGIIPCTDRPEVWPLWIAYGVWLMRRDRGARLLVIGMIGLMLALWLVPQKLGGGSIAQLWTHPRKNHSIKSAVHSSFPFWSELDHTLRPLVIERLELAALLMIAFTGYLLLRARRRLGGWHAALRRYPAAVAGSLAGIFGFVWWLGIAVETQAGFAGNPRYAVIGVMFVVIAGAAAYGWACVGLATAGIRALAWQRRRSRRDAAPSRTQQAIVATLTTFLVLVVFAIAPESFARRMPSVGSIRSNLSYQAHLRNEDSLLIQQVGGRDTVLRCGSVLTHNLQVTMVAWYLDVPIPWVQALPRNFSTEIGPNVVFQDSPTPTSEPGPTNAQMQAWQAAWKQHNGSQYRVVRSAAVTLYMNCNGYSRT